LLAKVKSSLVHDAILEPLGLLDARPPGVQLQVAQAQAAYLAGAQAAA
jgi:hypothetical protein